VATPLLYGLWVGASALLVPFVARSEVRKLRNAGVSVDRAHEKLGHATERRQDGQLIWFHGASVGESLSVLALIDRMGRMLPEAQFLITSGTATSAQLIASRLPRNTVHQFAPLDAPGPLKRFLAHWRPDAALFVESELWPQMLRRTHAAGARMAMVNARMSSRSIDSWRKRPALARYLFEVFDLILTQNDMMAEALVSINAPADRVARGINLKSMAGPLPVDDDLLFEARASLGHRPVWVASSTHEGEEEIVLKAHANLLERCPDLCLILAPRHPERGDTVAQMIKDNGFSMTRRTAGEMPGGQVYLADTMGELGTWYRLSDIVFLGGSLLPIGGHNPFEVAHAGSVCINGPHFMNFIETYNELQSRGASLSVKGETDLAQAVYWMLTDDRSRKKLSQRGLKVVYRQGKTLDMIATRLVKVLGLGTNG
jgi:3-deoxy-D-manno-octulosonic-acid transferase